jgi:hypothetical protein
VGGVSAGSERTCLVGARGREARGEASGKKRGGVPGRGLSGDWRRGAVLETWSLSPTLESGLLLDRTVCRERKLVDYLSGFWVLGFGFGFGHSFCLFWNIFDSGHQIARAQY